MRRGGGAGAVSNSSFMEFMRENYLSEIIRTQPFNMTVVDLTHTQDCSESEEEGE